MENNLPQGWVECSIGEILISKKGKKPSSTIDEPKQGYVPYILIDEMEGKPIRTYTNDPKVSIIDESEVLLVWDGSIGKCGSGLKGAIGSTLVGLKPLNGIPTKFLEYTIKLQNNFIKESSTGIGLQHINKDFFEICKIPLAPLSEQLRIVSKLDDVMQKVESNKQRLVKIPLLLKRLRQSILASAINGRLTEDWRVKNKIVEDWEETTLGSITDLITSGSRGWAKYYSDKGSTFVRAQNISKDFLDLSDIAFVSLQNTTEGLRTLIKQNDILVTITGANVTKTAHVDFNIEDAYVSQHVGLVRVKENIISKFVYLFLISESHGRKQLLASAYGQGKPQLNLDNIKSVDILLPSPKEQKEIIRRAGQLFAFADKLEARYTKAKTMIDKLPQSILSKAFRGELVLQNPNDEPASVLLERIKKEKEKLEAEKKGKKSKAHSIEEKPLRVAAEGIVKYKKTKV